MWSDALPARCVSTRNIYPHDDNQAPNVLILNKIFFSDPPGTSRNKGPFSPVSPEQSSPKSLTNPWYCVMMSIVLLITIAQ